MPDRRSWEQSCAFMTQVVSDRLQEVRKWLQDARGPSFISRWTNWQYQTPDHRVNQTIQKELRQIIDDNPVGVAMMSTYFRLTISGTQAVPA